jgi:pimeloyl-ACP methyl ester carboxylesterase
MTTAPVFTQHNTMVRTVRDAERAQHPAGTLVAGHKKDVIVRARLATSPGKVAIFGWHRLDGSAIQPLFVGHAATWVDYSHGVRLVKRETDVAGVRTTVEAVLADKDRCEWLSDEGVIAVARYGEKAPERKGEATASTGEEAKAWPEETMEEINFESGVRVVINAPKIREAAKPVRLVLYGAPAGNTIEQTMGRKIAPGGDWHFDIQHIAAQTRWLRARMTDATLVVAYLQAAQRSFVLWKRAQPEHPRRAAEIVEALRKKFPGAKLVLTGHSAGGAFTFSYLDGVEAIPDDVERIALLDSNYAYETEKRHGEKLMRWLDASKEHRLCVLAYQDYVALLEGKTFVSENGGTWGRSQAMLRDLGVKLEFVRTDLAGGQRKAVGLLQRQVALDGRVEFLLQENPEKKVLHTRQVEWNGFIQGMLAGTEAEGRGYEYLGERVYGEWVGEK